jgi:hypothetical protein
VAACAGAPGRAVPAAGQRGQDRGERLTCTAERSTRSRRLPVLASPQSLRAEGLICGGVFPTVGVRGAQKETHLFVENGGQEIVVDAVDVLPYRPALARQRPRSSLRRRRVSVARAMQIVGPSRRRLLRPAADSGWKPEPSPLLSTRLERFAASVKREEDLAAQLLTVEPDRSAVAVASGRASADGTAAHVQRSDAATSDLPLQAAARSESLDLSASPALTLPTQLQPPRAAAAAPAAASRSAKDGAKYGEKESVGALRQSVKQDGVISQAGTPRALSASPRPAPTPVGSPAAAQGRRLWIDGGGKHGAVPHQREVVVISDSDEE